MNSTQAAMTRAQQGRCRGRAENNQSDKNHGWAPRPGISVLRQSSMALVLFSEKPCEKQDERAGQFRRLATNRPTVKPAVRAVGAIKKKNGDRAGVVRPRNEKTSAGCCSACRSTFIASIITASPATAIPVASEAIRRPSRTAPGHHSEALKIMTSPTKTRIMVTVNIQRSTLTRLRTRSFHHGDAATGGFCPILRTGITELFPTHPPGPLCELEGLGLDSQGMPTSF